MVYQRFLKRPMDFVLSSMAIIGLSPVILIVGILVRIKLGSPILFKQKRPGLNEKVFTIYKFRTMTDERNEKGELFPDSVRLTKFGKMLRTSSLDELPELFNILKGDMSIVGPRPLVEDYLAYYTDEEKLRHSIRPGLSGMAQISGRNNLGWDNRLGLDVQYVQNITFILDVKIIAKSILKAFKREDVTIIDQASLNDLNIERSEANDNKKPNN